MKYKDYYAVLGVARDAKPDAVRDAYRKLARKFHPDVSKDPKGEEKFKEIAEAYQTLKDPEKRAAYDRLGSGFQPGQDFRPPPGWEQQFRREGRFGDGGYSFDDLDLSDLFASVQGAGHRGARSRATMPLPGADFEVTVHLALEDADRGTQVDLDLTLPEVDGEGRVRPVPKHLKARIPRGATDGQRLRLRGQGGKGARGGRDGDLYLNIVLDPHPLFRPAGHDLYLDLPLSPWEAALGASVEVPTLSGAVRLKVAPGTPAGRKLRFPGKGLAKPGGGEGDLYAIVQIVNPAALGRRERELYASLAEESRFDPRSHFPGVKSHGG